MIRRFLLAVPVVLFALAAFAQTRFTIERIEVRNAQRISPQLIAAETLLREGSEVSEEDVRAAVRRLGRLPFLFSADYVLEPGTDASRRVLAINVRENRRFWFLLDGRFIQRQEPVDMLDYDYPDPSAEWGHTATGVRWLFNDGGVAHFGMTVLRHRNLFGKNYSAWELGYTRHRLFGTRLFATAIVRSPVDSLEEKTFSPEAILGVPLNADQTLTLEYEDTWFRKGEIRVLDQSFDESHAERVFAAAWTFDTRNEPYVPTRGTFLRVRPFLHMFDQASFSFSRPPFGFETAARHATATGVDFVAERHWELSEVSSISGGVEAGWATIDNRQNPDTNPPDLKPSFEVIKGAYARKFFGGWAELEGKLMLRQVSQDRVSFGPDGSGNSYEIGVAWARRSDWGALRVGIAYSDR